jgi:two-component system phosphate regulon sensor histidine kinase PhoR
VLQRLRWRLAAAFIALNLVTVVVVALAGVVEIQALAPSSAALLLGPWLRNLALWLLLSTGLALALGFSLARAVLEPLDQVAHLARRVAAGDLRVALPQGPPGELGALVRTMNEMAGAVRQRIEDEEERRTEAAAILAGMGDGVVIVDGEHQVIALNRAAERLLEISAQAARGRTVAEVVRHHDLVRALASDGPPTAPLVIEVGHEPRQVQVVVTPVHLADATRQVILLQDVTELRQAETIRRDFVANVSHELRTPLASLRALVETLEDGALDDPPAAREFLGRMHVEVDGLTQMVEELLELARIESGRVHLRFQRADVGRVVAEAAERLRPQAERQSLTLAVRTPPDALAAMIDADRVHQVVINLVHNAIKFTPPGGSIGVSVERRGDQVAVVVSDTGVGVDAADLPRLFERFYKVDRSRSTAGTGLGLAIVKHLVQAHAGRVWADSPGEGQGTTFTVELPTLAWHAARWGAPAPEIPASAGAPVGPRRNGLTEP